MECHCSSAENVLYLAVRGLGIGHLSFWQALAVYLFSLAFALITPIPLDIGSIEVSGVSALVALGVDEMAAMGVMLINRVLSIGASVAIALVVVLVLQGERRTAFQERPSHLSAGLPATTPADDP